MISIGLLCYLEANNYFFFGVYVTPTTAGSLPYSVAISSLVEGSQNKVRITGIDVFGSISTVDVKIGENVDHCINWCMLAIEL